MPQIPLFPLHLTLFPGVALPLRIFEQRYLRLVSETLKSDRGFGVVPIRSGGEVGRADVWPYGLYVRIVDWSQGEEGLLHIQVAGQQRFRIRSTDWAEDGLLLGNVEWLPQAESKPVPEECDGLLSVLDELKQHAAMLPLRFGPVDSADALSWQLAQLLPLEDRVRVELLATDDPLARLADIAANLDRWAKE
ncbi:LON peptidase substrate-binding domain-containing protein [Microbulbifer thermotolerans]|uniref:ATP-dependent protease La domain-containing protein n=1 Tax=Microbulbifer thermotolerans TaxID=252514 RepID=A0A143HK69_MICTH|nr:LON peptidase substrate-binding domain-containing protein [Microbulbifer thermotolerans]AMX01901.1 ATP-dependent protease La domain-containing protein [Microbulbifer thermotolerans]MCX2801556.1 LON peptidase substrate-binding domain-containing protein [Microbulbifer thermotolerans]MCX2835399.1 LON peptidase substrate-binding domain-containing protein [Microbulbifer thermotolerans]